MVATKATKAKWVAAEAEIAALKAQVAKLKVGPKLGSAI